MAGKGEHTTIEAAGKELRLSSPSKVYFPAHGGRRAFTKLDLAEGTVTELIPDGECARSFALSPERLYWIDVRPGDEMTGRILRMDR